MAEFEALESERVRCSFGGGSGRVTLSFLLRLTLTILSFASRQRGVASIFSVRSVRDVGEILDMKNHLRRLMTDRLAAHSSAQPSSVKRLSTICNLPVRGTLNAAKIKRKIYVSRVLCSDACLVQYTISYGNEIYSELWLACSS